MKELLYEIPIDRPLTPAKRKTINDYIAKSANRSPIMTTHEWENSLLRIKAPPMEFEVVFHPENVVVHGSVPTWAKFLATEGMRVQLEDELELMLSKTGFFDS